MVGQRLPDQVQVQPPGDWDDHQRIAGPGADRERLEHLAGVDAQRPCFVGGGVGLPVGEQLEGAAPLLQVFGHGRHHQPPPRPRAAAANWTPCVHGHAAVVAYRTRRRRRRRVPSELNPAALWSMTPRSSRPAARPGGLTVDVRSPIEPIGAGRGVRPTNHQAAAEQVAALSAGWLRRRERAPTGWHGTTTTGWTGRWRRSAGKLRSSAASLAPGRSGCCACMAPTSMAGGLHAQGVAIVPASLLRSALGCDRVLSDAEVGLLATAAWTRLHPAA
jgi:hypothetical protein